MRIRTDARRGMAIIFVLGVLALIALLGTQFTLQSHIERTLGGNYVWQARAKLAMESGLEFALSRIREQCPGGPIEEAVLREWGYDYDNPEAAGMRDPAMRMAFAREARAGANVTNVSGVVTGDGAVLAAYDIRVADESGKLNLNDVNDAPVGLALPLAESVGWEHGRLYAISRLLIGRVLQDEARGRRAADALFLDAATCRFGYPGDRFPGMPAVERALTAAGLTEAEQTLLQDYFTLHSWRDPNVLKPNLRVYGRRTTRQLPGTDAQRALISRSYDVIGVDYGAAGNPVDGDLLINLLDMPVESNLAIQGRDWELEARAPVNVNTARKELLYALIRPLQGVYLEEGPVENQSSEHYGWWATGLGEPDANVFNMGRLKLTAEFTEERAWRLAEALYDWVHGIGNADLRPEAQPDGDGDGRPDPNPFETWEEFSRCLRREIVNDTRESPAAEIYLGDEVAIDSTRDAITPYDAAHGFVDPHRMPPLSENQWYRDRHLNQAIQLCNRSGNPTTWTWGAEQLAWWQRYFREIQCDLLCAAFNPNAQLNDFNPNANIFLRVDKGQLCTYSTELCLEPTGVFGLHSRGRVLGPDAAVLAEMSAAMVARLFEPLRITSQAQFLEGLEDAANLGQYFSMASVPAVEPMYFQAHNTPAGRLSLQSYPEPVLLGSENSIRDSHFDGHLMPATLDPERIGGSVTSASFNGCNLEPMAIHTFSGAVLASYGMPHADPRNRIHSGPLHAIDDSAARTPGAVYPDGAYSETGRVLAYRLRAFSGGSRVYDGITLGFWFKPNFHTGIATRIRKFCTGPTRAGRYARQTLYPLYFLPNPASNEFNGYTVNDNPVIGNRKFSFPCPNTNSAPNNASAGFLHGLAYRNYWTPTRSLAFGFAWQNDNDAARLSFLEGGVVSRSVTNDFPLAEQPEVPEWAWQPARLFGHVPGHQWSFIHAVAKPPAANGSYSVNLRINSMYSCTTQVGTNMEPVRGALWNRYYGVYSSARPAIQSATLSTDWWCRFGELPAGCQGGSPEANPYAADATFDDIGNVPTTRFNHGRYLGVVTSDNIGQYTFIGHYTSPRLNLQAKLGRPSAWTLRAMAWTLIRPRHNRIAGDSSTVGDAVMDNVEGIVVNPNDKPDPLGRDWASDTVPDHTAWDPMSADFRVPNAPGTPDDDSWYYRDSHDEGWEQCLTYPGGSVVPAAARARYQAGDDFQFRLYFHLRGPRQRLFEAPVLDDVTLTFWRATPEIVAMESGR